MEKVDFNLNCLCYNFLYMKEGSKKWRFAIDMGGTFTDVIGINPKGKFYTLKILSHSPDYKDPVVEGIRVLTGIPRSIPISKTDVDCIRLGTTIATNALLERKGGRILLITTKGFSDLLEIGYQTREELFNLCIKKPEKLYSKVLEIEERIDVSGKIIIPLDKEKLYSTLLPLKKEKFDTVAVVFIHAWNNPFHEIICEEVLRKIGFQKIYLSHKTMPKIKMVSRGLSTVLDAYLSPVLSKYLDTLKEEIVDVKIEFFISSGGLVPGYEFKGRDALLSGPAGGVVAVSEIAQQLGLKSVIGFDMGGTSTDVMRYDGEFERLLEKKIAGITIQTEMLNIHTVAAGGGSILWFDGKKMRVGPCSAGAYPGPACYGFGGPLTITDANLMIGRLIPDFLPHTFGAKRNCAVNLDIVKKMFNKMRDYINQQTSNKFSSEEIALGFLKVANEKMAMAIKDVSISKGVDVRDYTLICFGGAGGQHACEVASLLGIKEIVFHPLSGLLSAYGIALAKPEKRVIKTFIHPYTPEIHKKLSSIFTEMENKLVSDTNINDRKSIEKEIDLRVKGSDSIITVKYMDYEDTLRTFINHHKRLYGFYRTSSVIEILSLRVIIKQNTEFFPPFKGFSCNNNSYIPKPIMHHRLFTEDGFVNVAVFHRKSLTPGFNIEGFALVIDEFTTVVIDKGFVATVCDNGIIIAKNIKKEKKKFIKHLHKPDPVMLEIFNNLFAGIATEMGHTLRNTAHSVNIRERLDFSCAIFDPKGGLVANAPHIPVHIGSMADTVEEIIKQRGADLRPGDVYITNNPYCGGSHLPDITLICPVFSNDGELMFFTASRGHHSDIGGRTAGSIPPQATHIDEEGVLIDGFLLIRDGCFREEELRRLLMKHPYPVRELEERIADIIAQIAACRKGEKELKRLIERYGYETVKTYMYFIQDNAEYSVKVALWKLLNSKSKIENKFEDYLDDGTLLKVNVIIEAGSAPPDTVKAVFDFTGTAAQHYFDNLNTPLSVTKSAVLYVLRSIINTDIPLNSGCLRPIKIIAPKGSLLNPIYPVPVASGNVETSQRVVDILLGAIGIAAASQGTMNNILFEVKDEPPYYETIGGGAGAIYGCPGASGVQVHMTNTRITDPEILELRHPGIRLKRFSIRRNSGGKGKYPGGDGLIREIQFLKPATVTIISERRKTFPFGIKGGKSGKYGVNLLRDKKGKIKRLPHRITLKINPGESIIIKTPGGGAYGIIKYE